METYTLENPFANMPNLEYNDNVPYRKGGRYHAKSKDYIRHKRIVRKIAKHSRQINRRYGNKRA